jgi:hypothetical protein
MRMDLHVLHAQIITINANNVRYPHVQYVRPDSTSVRQVVVWPVQISIQIANYAQVQVVPNAVRIMLSMVQPVMHARRYHHNAANAIQVEIA